jgi:hypothetical protein
VKKIVIVLILSVLMIFQSLNAYAYYVYAIPNSTSFTWRPHTSLGLVYNAAATGAANTWNSAPGNFNFFKGSQSSGDIFLGDGVNDIFRINFSSVPEFSNTAIGVCYAPPYWDGNKYRIDRFEIALNTLFAWGSGNSNSYHDMQGAFTHEFGHALGLDDSYLPYTPLQTMYYNAVYQGQNCSYDWRTLALDDKLGKQFIANQI